MLDGSRPYHVPSHTTGVSPLPYWSRNLNWYVPSYLSITTATGERGNKYVDVPSEVFRKREKVVVKGKLFDQKRELGDRIAVVSRKR